MNGAYKRTFLAGGSNIGIPLFTYVVSPIAASGVTSLNPDVMDLFVEQIDGETFLSEDGTWKPMQIIEEVIKVRLGTDVKFTVKFTDNGVILPRDLLEGKA